MGWLDALATRIVQIEDIELLPRRGAINFTGGDGVTITGTDDAPNAASKIRIESAENPPTSPNTSELVDIATDDHVFVLAVGELYVGGAGDVVMLLAGDSTAITLTFAAGERQRLKVIRVYKTGTTATNIRGLGTT